MTIRIEGTKEECLDGIAKLREILYVLDISDFEPVKDNPQLGTVYVKVEEE